MPSFTAFIKSLVILAFSALVIGAFYLYSGLYSVGADQPHNKFTYLLLETLRERAVARAAADIKIPENLADANRLLAGGADYNDMCAGCHLQPGKSRNDLTLGLYPSPPNLSQSDDGHEHTHASQDKNAAVQRQFWIIKHGIKASGMPAWGPTHEDARIWNMVAFLQRLPELTEEQYQILTSRTDNDSSHPH